MSRVQPMMPMEPLRFDPPWWPADLGQPASSGAQDGLRYAVFPDRRLLLVERDGVLAAYDTGQHHIGGVSQASGADGRLAFTSQSGPVDLLSLPRVG